MRFVSLIGRVVIAGAMVAGGISADADWIYWTDYDARRIMRADLNTFNVETLIDPLAGSPARIALDVAGGKMYWTAGTQSGPYVLQRANLDGTEIETVLNTSDWTIGIALDLNGGRIYWNEGRAVRRANLDGSNVQTIATGSLIQDLTLDLANRKVYYTNWPQQIERTNLDGSGWELVLATPFANPGPVGVGVDAAAGKVYWAFMNAG